MLATAPRDLKTIVVSRNNLFREGLRSLLAGTEHEVRILANDVDDLHRLTPEEREGAIVLLDDCNDTEQTVDAIRRLGDDMPETPVIVLSSRIQPPLLAACLSAGASGYLLVDISFEALVQSLELVALGEKVFPTQLAALFISEIGYSDREMAEGADVDKLSERQRQILQCLVKGASNKVIARRLDITDATVKVHMKGLLRKIHVENRTQAAIWALNHGLTATVEVAPH
jgi:two-component system, NarL family, nitrate/nitrite response regulator NarL